MASNMIVLGFEGETTAEDMLETFLGMQEKELITIEDAVIASRGVGQNVEIKQTQSVKGKYTLRGSGIGLLAGFLLGGPIGGLIGGTAIGAISGALKDIGIDDKFVRQASEALGPNSSALFLLGTAQDPAAFSAELRPFKATVAMTTLSPEQEKRLKETLADEE
jgi:uncharacterized membrane protein